MADRDKVEPFWARPARLKRRSQPPSMVVPPREPEPEAKPPSADPQPAEVPQEPSFAVSHEARRRAIAEIMAGRPAPPASEFASPQEPVPIGGWVSLSEAEAARHPLFGVQGWLIPVAILIGLGLFRALVELVDFWATTDHGGLAAWIMAILRSAMAIWAALILGLLLGRSRAFPTNFIAYGMVNVVYLALFGLAFAHVTHGAVFAGAGAGIAVNLLAIAYVMRSRRVNVTFRKRVRATTAPPAEEAAAPPAAALPT